MGEKSRGNWAVGIDLASLKDKPKAQSKGKNQAKNKTKRRVVKNR